MSETLSVFLYKCSLTLVKIVESFPTNITHYYI